MNLIKYYNPEFEFSPFNGVLDQLLALEGAARTEKKMLKPYVDIAETDKSFIINLTVPGVKKEDLKIEVNEDKLTISCKLPLVNLKKPSRYLKMWTKKVFMQSKRMAF